MKAKLLSLTLLAAACGCKTTDGFEPSKAECERGKVLYQQVQTMYKQDFIDGTKIFKLCLEAANYGHPQAQFELAKMYRDGIGCNPNFRERNYWLYEAGKAGVKEARKLYTLEYADFDEEPEWLAEIVEEAKNKTITSVSLKSKLEAFYKKHSNLAIKGVIKEKESKILEQLFIDHGKVFPIAKYYLSLIYLEFDSHIYNSEKGIKLMEETAHAGQPDAEYKIGYWHQFGRNGKIKDHALASQWYKKAADAGHERGCYRYARMCKKQNDIAQACKYFQKSANKNNMDAMHELALIYHYNSKCMDYEKARHWYEMAIDYGRNRSSNNLGVLWFEGLGGEQDYKKAFELYTVAAEAGNYKAYFNLGEYYLIEDADKKADVKQAKFWLKKAADKGVIAARDLLDKISK